MFTTLYINFSDTQGQMTLELVVVSGQNFNSSKLSCMSSVFAKMRMIESKMKELGYSQDFFHYIPNKKRNAYSDIFLFILPFLGSSCFINKVVTNYRFVMKLQCDINK